MDKCINKEEFINMYKRCVTDTECIEPKKLFNLTQFLMFDKGFKGYIIEEDSLELMINRYKNGPEVVEKLAKIFPRNDNSDEDVKITYPEYLKTVNAISLEERRKRIEGEKKKEKERTKINASSTKRKLNDI